MSVSVQDLADEINEHVIHRGLCSCGARVYFEPLDYKSIGHSPREMVSGHMADIVFKFFEEKGVIDVRIGK